MTETFEDMLARAEALGLDLDDYRWRAPAYVIVTAVASSAISYVLVGVT